MIIFKLKIKEPSKDDSFILAGVVGFEPTKCRSQSPMPYRLAIPQYNFIHLLNTESVCNQSAMLLHAEAVIRFAHNIPHGRLAIPQYIKTILS